MAASFCFANSFFAAASVCLPPFGMVGREFNWHGGEVANPLLCVISLWAIGIAYRFEKRFDIWSTLRVESMWQSDVWPHYSVHVTQTSLPDENCYLCPPCWPGCLGKGFNVDRPVDCLILTPNITTLLDCCVSSVHTSFHQILAFDTTLRYLTWILVKKKKKAINV